MRSSSALPDTTWEARGSREALRAIEPLIEAHRRTRPVRLVDAGPREFVEMRFQGLTGMVPDHPALRQFALTASAVALREGPAGPVALLAQWDERAVKLAREAFDVAPSPLLWPAEVITGRDLPGALGVGLGASVYFGHGHAGGWDGYWGVSAPKLAAACLDPTGVVYSFTCQSARRPPDRFSFCEELVLSGYCAAAVGSAGRTSHRRNGALGLAVCRAMRESVTLADVWNGCGATWLSQLAYRVIGDPAARMLGAPSAPARARAVEATFWHAPEAACP